ncbi:MAG: HsdR family type I site-specific deoxyribonuclease [Actinomycetota bacterium]|nr:HsdR family type I site-specific deoxyribonuclease [Actinomycetota bacterium]
MTRAEPDDLGRSLDGLLHALGWPEHIGGAPHGDHPVDGRATWLDEIIESRLRAKLREINPGPNGEPWLDDARVDRIVNELRSTEPGLVEANKQVTEVLLQGVRVEGLPGWDQGRTQVAALVDWDHPENNDLLLVTDFRLDRPHDGGARFVVLDAVLFVNGIPFAAIEGVRPDREPTVAEAIADLRAYTGTRLAGERQDVPLFFRFVQALVATNGDEARVGTITSAPEHYAPWRTVEPATLEQVRVDLGYDRRASLTQLETLAAGVLRPRHLLDIVRNFTVFHQIDGRTVKIVARYQQFRAVHRMIGRLLNGRTRVQTGRDDERGGVIWHTQGSGKSFTMAFLVRKMRTVPRLADFKVVVVVDRTDLRDQLQTSLALAGETPIVAAGEADARIKLADDVPDVVTIMIQHAQRDEYAPAELAGDRRPDDPLQSDVHFPELNASGRVVLIVDEAHRSQRGLLHARLRRALPNAARIGFTGTPLLRADKESHTTEGIFGPFIDRYLPRDSEPDGATVPIRYEQRRTESYVVDAVVLDAAYEREVGGTPQQRHKAQQRWVTSRQALESLDFIGSKARDMLRHWVGGVLPNGFKAQVVAVSRLAAVRYRDALLTARNELVRELDEFAHLGQDAAERRPDAAFLRAALPFLPLLRVVDFLPLISAGVTKEEEGQLRHDPPEWRQWTSKSSQRDHIDRFKQRLPAPEELTGDSPPPITDAPWSNHRDRVASRHPVHVSAKYDPWHGASPDDNFDRPTHRTGDIWSDSADGPGGPGSTPVAFLIVMSMLLTGFDAPIEQVLYLDRPIRDVGLLQAIARTNRPARHKNVGLVVDYAGASRYLAEALSAYDEADLDGYKKFLEAEELPRLRDRRELVRQFLAEHGVGDIAALADDAVRTRLVALLADPELRTTFDGLVGDFLATLDVLLPRPQALEYEDDAARLGLVQFLLRRTYRDSRSGGLDPYRYGAKVRRLLDRHIRISGIIQRIPPVDVSAPDFLDRVDQVEDTRLRAMHMEHALRRRISQQRPTNPAYYERLSERLERVLQQLRDDPEQLARALDQLIRQERTEPSRRADDGLDPRTERLIYLLLEHGLGGPITEGSGASNVRVDLVPVTRAIVEIIVDGACAPHFLESSSLQNTLRKRVRNHLLLNVDCDEDTATPLADEIVGVVRARWEDFRR